MKNKTKKMTQYSALALAVSAVIPMSCNNNKNEEPDDPNITVRTLNDITQLSSGTGVHHEIDIDGNGATDILTYVYDQYGTLESGLYNYTVSTTKVLAQTIANTDGNDQFLRSISSGDLIESASTTWADYGYTQFKKAANNLGNFAGQGDKYAGIKFRIAAATHYGWMKLNLSSDGKTLTVKEVAYDTRPDTGIKAGAK